MESNREVEMKRAARFRPRLEGCVARDRYFAGVLEGCYIDAFSAVAANIYRSLVSEKHDKGLAELYEWIAVETLESFRLLGELIMALGGEGALRQTRRVRAGATNSFLTECRAERERNIDRYETLMSRTGDRVVRSIMAKLLAAERRMLEKLSFFADEKSC